MEITDIKKEFADNSTSSLSIVKIEYSDGDIDYEVGIETSNGDWVNQKRFTKLDEAEANFDKRIDKFLKEYKDCC